MIVSRIAIAAGLALAFLAVAGVSTATRANIIIGADDAGKADPDGRGSLLKIGPRFGLSDAEVTQVRGSTGMVYCNPVEPSGFVGSIEASAFLAGAADVVVTVRHIFDQAVAQGGRAALATCYFQQQTPPFGQDALVIKSGSYYFGESKGGLYADFAVVRLAKPVAGAAPLPLLSGPLAVGTPLLKISGREGDTGGKVDIHEPVATICAVRKLWPQSGTVSVGGATEGVPTGLYSDCDTHRGASGGAILIWAGTGAARHLEIAGLTTGTGDDGLDRRPYSASTLSHTFHIVTDRLVGYVVEMLAGKPKP